VTRQPDFATSPRRTRERPRETLASWTGVLAVALAAGGAWRARGEAQEARARLTEVRREATAASARLQSLEARSGSEAPTLSAADAPPARILGDVASALPPTCASRGCRSTTRAAGAVELHVVARDAAAWDGLLARLEGVPELGRSSRAGVARRRSAERRPGPVGRGGAVRRGAAVLLWVAAASLHLGVTAPARQQRDEARDEAGRRREELERARAAAVRIEHRATAVVRAPSGDAAAARALRGSLLRATEGLGLEGVQIAVEGGQRGTVAARGRLAARGRQVDLLRAAGRLAEPSSGLLVERVRLAETGQDLLRLEVEAFSLRADEGAHWSVRPRRPADSGRAGGPRERAGS
jgi:hypothetical protein